MAKKLQTLLGNDHPLFVANIADLERASGNSGIDVKLIADATEQAHTAMRELGLDPADTTSMELYRTLDASVSTGRADELLSGASFALIDLGDGPVSFNLHDVIENYHHELTHDDRVTDHAQRHLRMEIVKRYAEHERTNEKTVKEVTKQVGIYMPSDTDYPVSTETPKAQTPQMSIARASSSSSPSTFSAAICANSGKSSCGSSSLSPTSSTSIPCFAR